jgi:hypothetical protein
LDVKSTAILAQLSGITTINVSNRATDKYSLKPAVQVVGINDDGSAIAGIAKTKHEPTHTAMLDINNKSPLLKNGIWHNLNINLNTETLRENILNKSTNDYSQLNDPQNWSAQIDQAIKDAVRNVGTKNLIGTSPRIGDITIIGIIMMGSILSNYGKLVLENALLFNGVRIFSSLTSNNTENFRTGTGIRLSLLPVIELERWLLLQTYSRIRPVAVALEK